MSRFNLQEELNSLSADPSLYPIPSELDPSSLSERELDGHLTSAITSIINDPDSLTHSSGLTFDVFCSILKHADAPQVGPGVLGKTLDVITTGLTNQVNAVVALARAENDDDPDGPAAHRTPLEMWAFLLQWFVNVGEKAGKGSDDVPRATKGKGKKKATPAGNAPTFDWELVLPSVLATMHRALRLPTARIWRTSSEKEAFIGCFVKPCYQLCEVESHLKNTEIKLGVFKTICLSVKFHGHGFGAQTSIIQNLTYFEHLSEPMAELLAILEKEFDHPQLADEVLRDVSAKTFAPGDQKGPRSFSKFLVKLAELSPRVVQKQMSLLLAHLDSDAHPMRMALVEIIGILIRDIAASTEEGDAEQKNKQIKRFFELLMERFLDLNSYVRSKVLQTLIKLCDIPVKLPKIRAKIVELTIRSLQDKTSSARRYSIQLLTQLLVTHPFGMLHGGTLNLDEWQDRYDKISEELAKVDTIEMEKARRDAGIADSDDEGEGEAGQSQDAEMAGSEAHEGEEGAEDDSQGGSSHLGVPKQKRKPRVSAADLAAVKTEQSAVDPAMINRLRMTKTYYADALRFITQLETAIPTLCELLVSTTKSEVLESMRFFRTAYEYNIQSAEVGIKTMLHLIWTKDNNASSSAEEGMDGKGVKASLIEVYKSLYFDVVPDLAPKAQVSRITKNMIERTYQATLAELTSLEELMRTMMADNGVHSDVINKLWQVYSTEQEIPKPQRQGAIIILGMLALAKREVVTERVDSLLKIGLGPLGMNDLVLARYTCIALQRLGGSAKKVKGSLADKTMRLPMDNPIFLKLQETIENAPRSPLWFGMAEQAINTIYLLGEQPDKFCSQIIRNLTDRVFSKPSEGDAQRDTADDEMAVDSVVDDDGPATPSKAPKAQSQPPTSDDTQRSFPLAQLVFVVGHVAIKHIVYLELVEREFKRRKDEKAKENAAAKTADKDGNDLDAVAGNAEDDIGDTIANIREREVLYGEKSLLAVYGPLISHIAATPKSFKSRQLRQAAVLSMTKLMCVSAKFCEEHLSLLFNILKRSKDPIVRSNIMIGLGDIAVSWGSLIDDNSDSLYQGLADSDASVKKNTLMVLTHLILNGIIKVKGQLGEMAKCLEDPDKRISDLAKLFFTELSTKDNALYNNLQDVISHLSIGKHAVDEETFERTMRFIFTFIEKEKQAESIVEKLCQRFRDATEERQWRDISFCLSLLPFKSERSMKKLIDGLPFYQDKLHEPTLYSRFQEILQKARANKSPNKPETELNEFEAILEDHKAKGLEDQALEADVAKKTKAAKKRAAKRGGAPAARQTRGRGRTSDEREEEAEDEEMEEAEEAPTPAPAPRAKAKAAKAKPKKAPPRRGGRRKVVDSDEEEDGDFDEDD